ncbi:MAG: nitroreductase/quinone reductase family protein [Mycobacteriaceae bacterium]
MTAVDRPRWTVRHASRDGLHPLAVFFGLAYALSWAWAIPLAVTGQVVHRGEGWPTHYPSLLGPAIAAFVVTAWSAGRLGVRDLIGRMVRWRVGFRWWLVAVSPLGFLALGLVIVLAAGKSLPALADFGRFSGTPAIGLVGVLLLITFIGGLGEETGWRGYALPQLQRRFSPLKSTMILAPLWFAWHLPQFFVIGTYRDFGPGEYVGMFLGLTCGAFVLTWLYNRTSSILLVIVWHGTYNFVGATQAATGTLAAVISTLIMIQGIALVILDLRARRRGRPSVLGPGTGQERPVSLWATKHVANPVVRPLLRRPIGHRLGRHVALLRYRGRRTGRSYELPVQYVRDGNRVWILPGLPEHKTWWRNLHDGAEVDLTLAGRRLHGHSVVLDQTREPELAEGVAAYLRGFPHARQALGATRPTPAEMTFPAQHRNHQGAVLVRIDLDSAAD